LTFFNRFFNPHAVGRSKSITTRVECLPGVTACGFLAWVKVKKSNEGNMVINFDGAILAPRVYYYIGQSVSNIKPKYQKFYYISTAGAMPDVSSLLYLELMHSWKKPAEVKNSGFFITFTILKSRTKAKTT
jgi:hypothetical protein